MVSQEFLHSLKKGDKVFVIQRDRFNSGYKETYMPVASKGKKWLTLMNERYPVRFSMSDGKEEKVCGHPFIIFESKEAWDSHHRRSKKWSDIKLAISNTAIAGSPPPSFSDDDLDNLLKKLNG